ncbi:hypothetical protein SAMN05444584_2077 [Acinetobacter apis]|uniref:Uncharacterized protein n=1 Tax=Acinetobacter apis TaxID=1229165 RepID=A0A217EIF5_9GAMM|nr:hypothetical protein SAMN05444584_2077 [Acinetobacter apis]
MSILKMIKPLKWYVNDLLKIFKNENYQPILI